MKKDIIDFYIIKEFIPNFLFSLTLFLSIAIFSFSLFSLIDFIVQYGITLEYFGKLFIFSLPEVIYYCLPISFFLGFLLTINRLNSDNEITIINISGRSTLKTFKPILYIAIILSSFSFAFNEFIVSNANFSYSKAYHYARVKRDLPIRKKNIFYKQYENNQLVKSFYAKEFNNNTMYMPVVEIFKAEKIVQIITAKKAIYNDNNWLFIEGVIYEIGNKEYKSTLNFSKYNMILPDSLFEISKQIKSHRQMNYLELKKYIKHLEKSPEKLNFFKVNLYQKIAFPLTTIAFFFIAIPLSLRKKSKSIGLGVGITIIFIAVYYILMFTFSALGSTGVLPAIMGSFLPNIITTSIGLIWILKKEKSI